MSKLEKAKELEKLKETIEHKDKLINMDLNRGISTWNDSYDRDKAAEKVAELEKQSESK